MQIIFCKIIFITFSFSLYFQHTDCEKEKASSSKCKNLLPEFDSKEDGGMESRRTVVSKQVITPVLDVKPGNKKCTSREPPKPKKTKNDKKK